jgi:hypothetical protein
MACALIVAAPISAQRPEPPAPAISNYIINAEIDTAAHRLAAKVAVSFTPPENAETHKADAVSFGLHPALKVINIYDETGMALAGLRSPDGSIRIVPATPFVRGQAVHWTFEYEGVITSNRNGPAEGVSLAAIEEPIACPGECESLQVAAPVASPISVKPRRNTSPWPTASLAIAMTSSGTSLVFPAR